jgi:polyphosphate kinase 2 (PPK2 family)
MNYSKRFVVEPDAKVKLHKIDPGYIDPDVTEKDALAETQKLCKRLRELQTSLYCEKQRSVLIVLQALDTAGKDGVINHVLGAMNPLSCRVASFKKTRTGGSGTQLLVAGKHFPAREGRGRHL